MIPRQYWGEIPHVRQLIPHIPQYHESTHSLYISHLNIIKYHGIPVVLFKT